MIKLGGSPRPNPYCSIIIRSNRKWSQLEGTLLFHQRAVKESVGIPAIAKPDIALSVDQLRIPVRMNVVGFRIACIFREDVFELLECLDTRKRVRGGIYYPDAVVPVHDLGRVIPEYREILRPFLRIASGIRRLLRSLAGYDSSFDVQRKAFGTQVFVGYAKLFAAWTQVEQLFPRLDPECSGSIKRHISHRSVRRVPLGSEMPPYGILKSP